MTVKTVAVEPNGTLVPTAAKINFTVASMNENDLLFSSLFEPPALAEGASDSPSSGRQVSLPSTPGGDVGNGTSPEDCLLLLQTTVSVTQDGITTCGWVSISINFDEDECEAVVNVNINPDPITSVTYFRDHLSWVEMRVATGASTLRSAVIFSVNASGSGEGGVASANDSASEGKSESKNGRIVWGTVSCSPQYGGGVLQEALRGDPAPSLPGQQGGAN